MEKLEKIAKEVRQELLGVHYKHKTGELGIELSCVDILTALYFKVKQPEDIVVISKSHAALALYAIWHRTGLLNDKEYGTLHHDGSPLGAHVTYPHSEFASGSLGHGPSFALGLAYAKKLNKEKGNVYCLVGDGEMTGEGSCWEALLMASRMGTLDNLVILCDHNGWRAYDKVEYGEMTSVASMIKQLNFTVLECDGHDFKGMIKAITSPTKRPKFIVIRTIIGKGVPTMENTLRSHYSPPNDEEYKQGIQ